MSRNTHLKIKIKTLVAEVAIIRLEERKALTKARYVKWGTNPETGRYGRIPVEPDEPGAYLDCSAYWGLVNHRKGIVRDATRTNLLAYGFLRGRSYEQMERTTRNPPDLKEVEKVARRFGLGQYARDTDKTTIAFNERWKAWVEAAEAHLESQAESEEKAA